MIADFLKKEKVILPFEEYFLLLIPPVVHMENLVFGEFHIESGVLMFALNLGEKII